jgi:hypothetical protein
VADRDDAQRYMPCRRACSQNNPDSDSLDLIVGMGHLHNGHYVDHGHPISGTHLDIPAGIASKSQEVRPQVEYQMYFLSFWN